MTRREAIATVSYLMGGSIIGAELFLSSCAPGEPDFIGLLSENNYIQLMEELAETILPATENSPGAKEAKVGSFMNIVVTECYDEEEQKIFMDGIVTLNNASQKLFNAEFLNLEPKQKYELLLTLEEEIKVMEEEEEEQEQPENKEVHYYKMMKQLTLLGFLTSEIGVTKAMRHVAIPGRYDGCVPHKEGEKVWA